MDKYEDFHRAIASEVFVSGNSGERLIGSDERSKMEWVFDFRALILQPQWINRYAEIFWQLHEAEYPFQVGGMETAAIPFVAAIVMKGIERGTPVNGLYIRKSRKRVGRLRQVEGMPNAEKVILVDDLINSGSTFKKQILILEDINLRVSSIFALIAFKAQEAYASLGPRVQTIFTLEDFGLPLQTAEENATAPSPEIMWRFRAPGVLHNYVQQKSTPAIDINTGNIYFGTDSGSLLSLDQKDGTPLWEFAIKSKSESPIFSSPLLHKEMLYFGANDGTFYALDKHTGQLRWHYDEADWVGSSPVVAPEMNMIFVGLEFGLINKQGALISLNADTGKIVWKVDLPGNCNVSPLYIPSENMVIMGDSFGNILGYDARDGSVRFRAFVKGEIFAGFSYHLQKRTVFFTSRSGVCYGIFVPTGDVTFAKDLGLPLYSTPAINNDTVFVSSLDKKIYAIDISSTTKKWSFSTEGRIFASPILIDNSLWCGSNDGKLYELDIQTGRLISSLQVSERIVNPISYDLRTRKIFVMTQGNSLYCLNLL